MGEVNAEKKVVTARGLDIPVISVHHLKQLKRRSGRKQDWADIEALEELERIENEED